MLRLLMATRQRSLLIYMFLSSFLFSDTMGEEHYFRRGTRLSACLVEVILGDALSLNILLVIAFRQESFSVHLQEGSSLAL